MKRIVFCFDGTWNRLDAPCPTNVVVTAQSITPEAKDGVTQIIHYDEGVGTATGEKYLGGLLGHGLMTNIADAYRFLIFNYTVGDEIYIFGFSRGAFSARSFAGFLRYCGILPRAGAGKISEAINLYQSREKAETELSNRFQQFRWSFSPDICVDAEDDRQRAACGGYVSGDAPVLRIRYLGVWDTVGALGIPESMLVAPWVNKKYRFHNFGLGSMVTSARHAVAIDEKRKTFEPTLWDNLGELNAELGYEVSDPDAPYQQQWFPGTHGSVGGGGDIRGLSDEALDWVIRGARTAGLDIDIGSNSPIFKLAPSHKSPIDNVSRPPDWSIMSFLEKGDRVPGPARLDEVSASARLRWAERAEDLPEGIAYRPKTLEQVSRLLDQLASGSPSVPRLDTTPGTPAQTGPGVEGGFYTVRRGDSLSAIAKAAYDDPSRYTEIFNANRGILTHPDRIYVGQVLRIP